MKKLIFLAGLLLLSISPSARAQGGQGQGGQGQGGQGQNQNCQGQQPPCTTRRIGATEMGAIGSGAAVLLGVAGYLVLRRRNSA